MCCVHIKLLAGTTDVQCVHIFVVLPTKVMCCCAGDSISGIADALGVDAFQLLYDNTEEIEDLEKPLVGKTLRVCGISE